MGNTYRTETMTEKLEGYAKKVKTKNPINKAIDRITDYYILNEVVNRLDLEVIIEAYLEEVMAGLSGVTETAVLCNLSSSRVRQLAKELGCGHMISGFLVFGPEDRERINARNKVGGWTRGVPLVRRKSHRIQHE